MWKRDDADGCWICDFWPPNAVTKKVATVVGDVYDKCLNLSSYLYTSVFDAWSGLNQVRAIEQASHYMTIATSCRLRQWTVMPSGVTNGPAVFAKSCMRCLATWEVPLASLLCNINLVSIFSWITGDWQRFPDRY